MDCLGKGKKLCGMVALVGILLIMMNISFPRNIKSILSQLSSGTLQVIRDDTKHILITGGLGTLGKALSATLIQAGYHLIILDVNNYNQQQLFQELSYQTVSPNRVKIVTGDIRNYSLIHNIHQQYNRLLGIVHLAGISHQEWCEENPVDCFRLNVDSTESFLQAIESLFSSDEERPWFLYLSSSSLDNHTSQNKSDLKQSSYVTSKLRAETIIKTFAHLFSQTTILRIPQTYGTFYDHSDRIIPYFVRQAMTHNPISLALPPLTQYYAHALDIVRVCVELINNISHTDTLYSTSSISTVSVRGSRIDHQSLLSIILNITNSRSLVRTINTTPSSPDNDDDDDDDDDHDEAVSVKVKHLLRDIDIHKGLQQYVSDIRTRDHRIIQDLFDRECSANVAKEVKLNKCTMMIYTNLMTGSMLTCGGPQASVRTTEDFSPHFRFVSAKRKQVQGLSGYYIQCVNSSSTWKYLGVVNNTVTLSDNRSVFFISYKPEDRSVALLISTDRKFNILFVVQVSGSIQPWDGHQRLFFLSPYCCEGKSSLPLLHVDPLIEKRKELSWYKMPQKFSTKCRRLKAYIEQKQPMTGDARSSKVSHPHMSSAEFKRAWSQVTAPEKPLCDRDCSLFTGCIQFGECRCVNDRCSAKHQYPHHSLIHNISTNFASRHRSTSRDNDDDDDISQLPFEAILQRHSKAFYQNLDTPRVHVLAVPSTLRPFYNDIDRYRLQKEYCYIADDIILRELQRISTNISRAEVVIVPFYHGFYMHYKQMSYQEQMKLIRQLEAFVNTTLVAANSSARVVFTLSHDSGGCIGFAWTHMSLVLSSLNHQIPSLHHAHLLQQNGDYNTNCYYPNKDVVIPPFTCLTPDLVATFGDLRRVKNILDRRVFAFFKGTLWGSGLATRARLSCPSLWQNTWPTTTEHDGMSLIQKYYNDSDYLTTLNESRFCLIAAGTTGWASRLADSVYAGCIPVFLTSNAHHPFEDILDYETFSIHIGESKLDTLEQKLLEYTDNELVMKQKYLLKVRTAFVFENYDGMSDRTVDESSPLLLMLLSLRMRLRLQVL